jgi:anti-anti-sigma factor
MSEMKIETRIVPAYAEIQLTGFINTFSEEKIEGEVKGLLDMGCPFILLDFSRVENINSAGITILIGIAAQVRDSGAVLAGYGLSSHYRKIFRMVGLEKYITLGESRQQLLDSWKNTGSVGRDKT